MPEPAPPRLLIVDDEEPQTKALCDTLRDHNYETIGFTTAKAALAALAQSRFDLLLSDLMMPETDGITLLQTALKMDPNLVGIIMTGQGTIETAVEAMKTGAHDYILKPFKLSAILPVLSRALELRRLRLQNEELNKRVLQRTAELEAANEELDAFAASVAHDLHAPARQVAGFGRMLMEDHGREMSEKVNRDLLRIVESAERMGHLIASLLALSRVTRIDLRQSSVDLNEVVRNVWRQLEPDTRGRQIRFNVAELPTVQADPSLMTQLFYNLLSNAIKYTRQRLTTVIEVGSQPGEGAETVIHVRDNGAGFDMAYARNLFGIFQRLHRQDEFEGSGVGLSTVHRIIKRHGGRVWAEGLVDKGATFYFTLPGVITAPS